MTMIPQIDPATLHQRMQAGNVLLIDIREASEFARERIAGARLAPLSRIDDHNFAAEQNNVAVFTCRSGARTSMNASRLAAMGFRECYLLAGGLDAWKKAGLPVQRDEAAPLDLQRQVQIAAGTLALIGAMLAWLVSPWFILLSGLVGAGLMLAGLTGWCGMAHLLALMPWNRKFLAAQ